MSIPLLQIFVSKHALTVAEPIVIVGAYIATPLVVRNAHGDSCTPLTLPANMQLMPQPDDPPGTPTFLRSNFREHMPEMVNGEGARRIHEAFPDYMQSNASQDVNNSITKYGSDISQWPADAQERKAEGDRGWTYIGQIRQTTDAIENNITLVDPTDNAHWPTVITPVYIAPAIP